MDNFGHFLKLVFWWCFCSWSKIYALSWSKYPLFVAILEVFVRQKRKTLSAHVSKELPIRIDKSKLILRTRTQVFPFFAQRILIRSLQKVQFYFTINHILLVMNKCSINGRFLKLLQNAQSYPYCLFNTKRL